MKLNELKESLKNLTPQQKLELLDSKLKQEKTKKGKEQILLFIEEAKQEQLDIEESLRNLQVLRREEKQEEPLENLVEEEQTQQVNEKKRREEIQHLYGTKQQEKSTDLYGTQNSRFHQEASPLRTDKDYRQIEMNRFNQERETFINSEKRLEKERKKYETGI